MRVTIPCLEMGSSYRKGKGTGHPRFQHFLLFLPIFEPLTVRRTHAIVFPDLFFFISAPYHGTVFDQLFLAFARKKPYLTVAKEQKSFVSLVSGMERCTPLLKSGGGTGGTVAAQIAILLLCGHTNRSLLSNAPSLPSPVHSWTQSPAWA